MAEIRIGKYGNFVLKKDEKKGFIAVRAVSGFWEMRFFATHPMFLYLLELSRDREMDKYLSILFLCWFITSQGLLDTDAIQGLVDVMGGQQKRWAETMKGKEISEEENEIILKEEERKEELRKELQEIEGEEAKLKDED